jgi:hypothetical protein
MSFEDKSRRSRVNAVNCDDKFFCKIRDSLIVRASGKIDKPTPGYEEFLSFSLKELARELLERQGQTTIKKSAWIVEDSLKLTDFPLLSLETFKFFLLKGFRDEPETWSRWTGERSVSDY